MSVTFAVTLFTSLELNHCVSHFLPPPCLFFTNSVRYVDRKKSKMWEEELFIGSYSPTPSPGERNKQAKLAIVKRSPAEDIQPYYLQFSCLLSGTELDQYLNKYLAFNFSGFKY